MWGVFCMGKNINDHRQLVLQAQSFHKHGRVAEAEALLEELLRKYPDHTVALNELGILALKRGQVERAGTLFEASLKNDSKQPLILFNLGIVSRLLNRTKEALSCFDQAIVLNPDFVDAYHHRGNILQSLNFLAEALLSYEKAFSLEPNCDFLRGALLNTKMKICDWTDFYDSKRAIEDLVLKSIPVVTPFDLLAVSDSLIVHRATAKIAARRYPENGSLGPIPDYTVKDKICIGYYSADFHNHATSYLMAELFELHDRNRFKIIAFSFGPVSNDEMQQRVSASFDKFFDVSHMSDLEVAKFSRTLKVDIAVDLKGYTMGCRTGIFSYRAAPIQVNYLGYPGTMGLDYIDYIIADRTLIPTESQPHYSEKIVYLPNSYQVNDTKRKISERQFSREELGLPPHGFVFCCFNNNHKITPDVFDCWMRILHQVSGSVLWILEDNPMAADNLRKEAESRDLRADRIVFAKRMPLPDHLARHRLADLFLDTLPYNAHTTASDALWAGLPVLTCMGETFASRVAASLLNAIHLPELITTSLNEFESLAVALALDKEKMPIIKQKLEVNRLTTPLFDAKFFTTHIELSYKIMCESIHEGLDPNHIFI